MSLITVKGKFHLAIDGIGLLLSGAPDRLAYQQQQAPIYGNRFAQGDRSYTDFSFWWYWTQTDFSGGIRHEEAWADDATYYSGEGVSTSEQPGSVILAPSCTNTAGVTKTMAFTDYGEAGTTGAGNMLNLLVGRNSTDQKMRIVDMDNAGTAAWEDTAVGATEKINCCDSYGGDGKLIFGCKTIGSGASKVKSFDGSSVSDIGAHTAGNGVYSIVCDPLTAKAYIFTLDGGIYSLPFGSTTYTSKIATYPESLDATYFSFGQLNGKGAWLAGDQIFFTMLANGCSHLYSYDITNNVWVFHYAFGRGYSPMRLIVRDGNVYLFGLNSTTRHLEVWKYVPDAGTMALLHELGRVGDRTTLVANPVKDNNNIYFAVDDNSSDYEIWAIGRDDELWASISPPASYATTITMLSSTKEGYIGIVKDGASGTNKFDTIIPTTSKTRQASGVIYTSFFDADIPAIDKLFHSVLINFKKLASSQSVTVEYSTDNGTTFTSLGSASNSVDGGTITSKAFYFGASVVGKRIQLRFTLAGAGSTSTSSLEDFSVKFLPLPDYTKAWSVNVNAGNEVRRQDGGLVALPGRELRGALVQSWLTKSLVDFQDTDFAQTTIDGGSLAAATTTVTVQAKGTADFPERGRLRIENEEITYTGKTSYTFTGCTRGARGTIAAIHADDTVVSNAYRVLITELSERVPVMLEDKNMEYVVGINFREA